MARHGAASPGPARAPAASRASSGLEQHPRAAPAPASAARTATRATRRCKLEGCTSLARSRGLCKAHGGGKRCQVLGCGLSDQGGGCCIRHGGGKRCQVAGCNKSAQSRHFCKAHGGGIRCKVAGCSKSSQGGGCCRSHGGGPRRPPKTRTQKQKQKQKQRALQSHAQAQSCLELASACPTGSERDFLVQPKSEPCSSATDSCNGAKPSLLGLPGILDRRRNRPRGLASPLTTRRQSASATTSPVIKTEAGVKPSACRDAEIVQADASYFTPANLLLKIQSLPTAACVSSTSTPSTADSASISLDWNSPASRTSSGDVDTEGPAKRNPSPMESPPTAVQYCSIGGCANPAASGTSPSRCSGMCEQHRTNLALATSLLGMQEAAKDIH